MLGLHFPGVVLRIGDNSCTLLHVHLTLVIEAASPDLIILWVRDLFKAHSNLVRSLNAAVNWCHAPNLRPDEFALWLLELIRLVP